MAGDLTGDSNLEPFRRQDLGNGLYWYLELLKFLRQQDRSKEGKSTTDDSVLIDRLRLLRTAPPARLYLTRQREMAEAIFRNAGLSLRASAVESDKVGYIIIPFREMHRSVFRELTDRLVEKGRAWGKVGRRDDAAAADTVAVRLLVDLIEDSPMLETAYLVAEKLPTVLRELDAGAEAGRIELFGRRLRMVADEDRVNLLPRTGRFVLAPDSHDLALGSLCAAGLSMLTWLVLALLCLLLLPIAAATSMPADVRFRWRWTGLKAWILPLIVCLPWLLLLLVIAYADLHFIWLFCLKSLPALLAWPAIMIVVVGLVTRFSFRPVTEGDTNPRSAIAAYVIGLTLLLTLLLGPLIIPVDEESWRPPVSIQLFRQVCFLLGAECLIIIVAWLTWAFLCRRRMKLPIGVLARGALRVVSVSLLLGTLISLAVEGINHRHDRIHQQTFVKASADPLSDRLGADWYQGYFQGIQQVLDRFSES
jgi:hypothetical protein